MDGFIVAVLFGLGIVILTGLLLHYLPFYATPVPNETTINTTLNAGESEDSVRRRRSRGLRHRNWSSDEDSGENSGGNGAKVVKEEVFNLVFSKPVPAGIKGVLKTPQPSPAPTPPRSPAITDKSMLTPGALTSLSDFESSSQRKSSPSYSSASIRTSPSTSPSKQVRLLEPASKASLEALREYWSSPQMQEKIGTGVNNGIGGYRRTRDIYNRSQGGPRKAPKSGFSSTSENVSKTAEELENSSLLGPRFVSADHSDSDAEQSDEGHVTEDCAALSTPSRTASAPSIQARGSSLSSQAQFSASPHKIRSPPTSLSVRPSSPLSASTYRSSSPQSKRTASPVGLSARRKKIVVNSAELVGPPVITPRRTKPKEMASVAKEGALENRTDSEGSEEYEDISEGSGTTTPIQLSFGAFPPSPPPEHMVLAGAVFPASPPTRIIPLSTEGNKSLKPTPDSAALSTPPDSAPSSPATNLITVPEKTYHLTQSTPASGLSLP